MWVPVAVWQPCELLYTCYLLTYLLTETRDQHRSIGPDRVTGERTTRLRAVHTHTARRAALRSTTRRCAREMATQCILLMAFTHTVYAALVKTLFVFFTSVCVNCLLRLYDYDKSNNNNQLFILATLRFDSAVQCHLTAWLFCEGGGGVRFIPAWFLYFFVLHS